MINAQDDSGVIRPRMLTGEREQSLPVVRRGSEAMARTFARRLERAIGDVRSSGSRLVKVDINIKIMH